MPTRGPFKLKFMLSGKPGTGPENIKDFSAELSPTNENNPLARNDNLLFKHGDQTSEVLNIYIVNGLDEGGDRHIARLSINKETGEPDLIIFVKDDNQVYFASIVNELQQNKELNKLLEKKNREPKIEQIKMVNPAHLVNGKLPESSNQAPLFTIFFRKNGAISQLNKDVRTSPPQIETLNEVAIMLDNPDSETISPIQVASISFTNNKYHVSFLNNVRLTENQMQQLRELTKEHIKKDLTLYTDIDEIENYFDSSFLPTATQEELRAYEAEETEKSDEKQEFDQFLETYQAYRQQHGNAHFSKVIDAMGMSLQSKINKNEITNMDDVRQYAEKHPTSFTHKILDGKLHLQKEEEYKLRPSPK